MSVKSIKKSLKRRFKRLKFKYWGLITPEHLTRCIYQRRLNKRLDLDNPKDLNEKIQWLKLRTNTSDWSILSDKYRVREFVKEQGCEDNLVKLYGRWCRAEDIDFENLPDSFVLKTNHGCGGIILVEDKSQLDIKSSRRNLNKWISRPYGLNHAEFHYKKNKTLYYSRRAVAE